VTETYHTRQWRHKFLLEQGDILVSVVAPLLEVGPGPLVAAFSNSFKNCLPSEVKESFGAIFSKLNLCWSIFSVLEKSL
jgi:hypothetical protein